MKKQKKRILSCLLAAVLMGVCVFPGVLPVSAAAPEYQNTYVNTGNQRQDILGVALTQVGYCEGSSNDTKYGTWNNLPYQPWCASFVSWCARQAEISDDIIKKTGLATPECFDVRYRNGSWYTPQPGDLFFTQDFSHTGFVYYVEDGFFYTIEGNGNADHSSEGFCVIINKRTLSGYYYFGVPEYEGCDKEHTYVKGQDASHPHKTYYACSTCGDKFYTGYTAIVNDCHQCFGCGCSSSREGYYLVNTDGVPMKLWGSHSRQGDPLGMVPHGAVVHALGASSNGWVYLEYDGIRGHVAATKLKAYYAAPDMPVIAADRTDYVWGDDVVITWNEDSHAEEYRLEILKDGESLVDMNMGTARSYTLEAAQAGAYEIRVSAANQTGWSETGVLNLTVRDTYTVTYDAAGGTGAPEAQSQPLGNAMTLSSEIPVREGFVFLGWTDEIQGCFVKYNAGDCLLSDKDLTLYAVWKDAAATAQSLQIEHMPQRTMFLVGESLDTTGLALRITYSDGSGRILREGYTTDGFCSEALGTVCVTVWCEELAVTYDVEIVACIPGDIDLDHQVTREDVMHLLWHITFPAEFPIETYADFNSDGSVNQDDVMQLLWHITFPAEFPLEISAE